MRHLGVWRTEIEAAGKMKLNNNITREDVTFAKEWSARRRTVFNQLFAHRTTKHTPSIKATLVSSLIFAQKKIPSVYFLSVLNTRSHFRSDFRQVGSIAAPYMDIRLYSSGTGILYPLSMISTHRNDRVRFLNRSKITHFERETTQPLLNWRVACLPVFIFRRRPSPLLFGKTENSSRTSTCIVRVGLHLQRKGCSDNM